MHGNNGLNNGSCNSGNQSSSFLRRIREFIGETVTIFTTSGGASGFGFTGVILSVDSSFVRLATDLGEAPSNPLAQNINNTGRGNSGGVNSSRGNNNRNDNSRMQQTGSVVDIPIDRIAAFCHNAT